MSRSLNGELRETVYNSLSLGLAFVHARATKMQMILGVIRMEDGHSVWPVQGGVKAGSDHGEKY